MFVKVATRRVPSPDRPLSVHSWCRTPQSTLTQASVLVAMVMTPQHTTDKQDSHDADNTTNSRIISHTSRAELTFSRCYSPCSLTSPRKKLFKGTLCHVCGPHTLACNARELRDQNIAELWDTKSTRARVYGRTNTSASHNVERNCLSRKETIS